MRSPLGETGYTIRRVEAAELSPAQEQQILGVIERAFNGGPRWFGLPVAHIDHWRWKVRDFPGTAEVFLIERDDTIVGTTVGQRRRYLVRGVERGVRVTTDSALDPSLQGLGLHSKNLDFQEQNPDPTTDFILGYSDHPASIHRISARGVRQVLGNPIEGLLLPLDVDAFLERSGQAAEDPEQTSRTAAALNARTRRAPRSRMARRLAWRARLLRPSLARIGKRAHTGGAVSLSTIERFDEAVVALFAAAAPDFELIQKRDAAYLNWRFCDPRAGGFTVRGAWQGGQLLGYCAGVVLEGYATLADLLVLPGRLDVAALLVQDALAGFRQAGAVAARSWSVKSHPYAAVLRSAGFTTANAPIGWYVPVRTPQAELQFLSDESARAHIVVGDTDHI
jgi:hypothetical protein